MLEICRCPYPLSRIQSVLLDIVGTVVVREESSVKTMGFANNASLRSGQRHFWEGSSKPLPLYLGSPRLVLRDGPMKPYGSRNNIVSVCLTAR